MMAVKMMFVGDYLGGAKDKFGGFLGKGHSQIWAKLPLVPLSTCLSVMPAIKH